MFYHPADRKSLSASVNPSLGDNFSRPAKPDPIVSGREKLQARMTLHAKRHDTVVGVH
jgi:hypothetical protein